ncbi:DUF3558 domain-containing protein [Nocardia sp. NPDC050710]|uniref:DUF3558 domain-containing protein n=1 Tax=Nocardia sp. NPDC050710 TaxID=3157220 RepID=UPI0033DA2D4D
MTNIARHTVSAHSRLHSGRAWTVAACALVVVAVGCTDSGGSTTPTSSLAAATSTAKPAKFDPCTDIPESVLRKEDLENRGVENRKTGEITWTGCGFQQDKGYDVRIVATSVTLDKLKEKYPDSYREQYFGGRKAAFYTLFPSLGSTSCVLNVELSSGTIEFDLSNQKSNQRTGHLDTCGLLTGLVEQVVPAIPPGA